MPKIVWRTCLTITFIRTLPDLSSNSRDQMAALHLKTHDKSRPNSAS